MARIPAPQDASTLYALLDAQAASRPQAVALRVGASAGVGGGGGGGGGDWTYARLAAGTSTLADLLRRECGLARGDRVAWLGLNHPMQLLLLFALARLGAVLVPLNYRLSPDEWDVQVAGCAPCGLAHDDAWADAAQALAQRHGIWTRSAAAWEAALHGGEGAAPAAVLASLADVDLSKLADPAKQPELIDQAKKVRQAEQSELVDLANAPVLLVHTSGTTSAPKAAVHTHANLLANMRAAAQVQGLSPQDKVLTVLPLFHVGGLCIQTLPALWAGAQVLLRGRFDAGATLQAIEHERPTLTLQVPATLQALLEHPRWAVADLSSLRAVWAGSSLLPASLVAALHARGLPVCNVYGATETGPFSIALPAAHARSHAGSCGWPAPGVDVRLVPPAHERAGLPGAAPATEATKAPDVCEGELWLRAASVVRHYWPGQPACDADGWFHTGDLARRAADGSYTIVGRLKELIISGGENIHPAEIEERLAEHPAVAECAAFGLPDARWGEAVAVALVLRPGHAASDDDLHAFLAERLARFKLPRRWLRLQALPRTALGKVQRTRLAALAASATTAAAASSSHTVASLSAD